MTNNFVYAKSSLSDKILPARANSFHVLRVVTLNPNLLHQAFGLFVVEGVADGGVVLGAVLAPRVVHPRAAEHGEEEEKEA